MKGAAPGGNHHAGIFKAIIQRSGERLHEEYLLRKRMIEARQVPPSQPVILIGDLQLENTGGSRTNDQIMNCFNNANGTTCTSNEQYSPPVKDTPACAADTCCIWSYIKDELVPLMRNADGTCNDFARNSVRLGFHDAGTWAQGVTHGGADGSLLLEPTEVLREANFGLELSRNILLPIFEKYRSYGISAADLVQFAHNVAVVVCPLGPRSLTYIGRPDWTPAAGLNQDGLLPDANADADSLIDLFADKTIGTVDLVALIGAHTTGKQNHFDVSKAGMPFDTTPGVWDVAFYSEVLNGTTPCGVFHLPSDQNIAAQAGGARNGFIRMSQGFPLDNGPGQIFWNGLYSKAYLRLSLLGVQNIQGLTDCTKVLPNEITAFDKPPSAIVSCPASSSSSIVSNSSTSAVSASSSMHASASASSSVGASPSKSSTAGSSSSKSSSAGSSPSAPASKSFSAGSEPSSKPYGPGSSSGAPAFGGPEPSSKPSYPSGDGDWGYHTKTTTVTRTKTITLDDGSVTTSCWNEPTTIAEPNKGPYKTLTSTFTKTKMITLDNGSATTSRWDDYVITTVWDDSWTVVPSVTKAAPTNEACQVKKVYVTTTIYE